MDRASANLCRAVSTRAQSAYWARLSQVHDDRIEDLDAWDAVADSYAEQPQIDWFDGFLVRHLGNVAGKRILDLGCGHGWFTNELDRCGADALGIDGSERLLAIARSRYPSVTCEQRDLRNGVGPDDGVFDAVVALMVLMDVADLSVLRPRLAPGGVVVATILHPAFYLQKTVDDDAGGYREVRGYLDEEQWWIDTFGGHRHYHRPLGHYVQWLASIGLGLVELFEPPAAIYTGWRTRIPTRVGLAARRIET
jgi:SAM-dependent methyltransferase